MRKTCKAHEAAVGQLLALQPQQAQLATKVQQQLDTTARMESERDAAKATYVDLSQRFHVELQGKVADDSRKESMLSPDPLEKQVLERLLANLASADPMALLGPGSGSAEQVAVHVHALHSFLRKLETPTQGSNSAAPAAPEAAMGGADATALDTAAAPSQQPGDVAAISDGSSNERLAIAERADPLGTGGQPGTGKGAPTGRKERSRSPR